MLHIFLLVCKFFATELKTRLDNTGKSSEVIETGHGLDKKKRFKYKTSELRLEESLNNPHICESILEYNVHAERDGSNRYAKGRSETMSTLEALHQKGVKVELGMPHELWHKPSAEVTKMQRWCYSLVERYEEEIEEWYYHKQDSEELMSYICSQRYLRGKNQDCLKETFQLKGDKGTKKKPVSDKQKKSKKEEL